MARQGSLSALIWQLYRDTHFYDFAGGLPGGKQRQANLELFMTGHVNMKLLRFADYFGFFVLLKECKNGEMILGAARALGEQEDVVRVMTIHSSKGSRVSSCICCWIRTKFQHDGFEKILFT